MGIEVATLHYSMHAVRQMHKRQISAADVEVVIMHGSIIEEYPDDEPLPSMLLSGLVARRPIHVVLAYDSDVRRGVVVTAYEPDPARWK